MMVAVLSSFYSSLHQPPQFGWVLCAAAVDAPPARSVPSFDSLWHTRSPTRRVLDVSAERSSEAYVRRHACQYAVAGYLIPSAAARAKRTLLASALERRPRSPDPQRGRRGAGLSA